MWRKGPRWFAGSADVPSSVPEKAEQLGGGYALSSFCERTAIEHADAVIAVSEGMRSDVLTAYPQVPEERVHVVHNGIDSRVYQPDPGTDVLERLGIDPSRPSVVFLGRITRQKGLPGFLAAARAFATHAQVVLLAGAPDTADIAAEAREGVKLLRSSRDVVWIEEILPRPDVVQILSHASVFVCPSVYEPFGLVNLEAMACGAPVVATATGGIPEVVVDGETGWLVPAPASADDESFADALADRVNALLADPTTAQRFGAAGRARVLERFTWPAVADRTLGIYAALGV